MPEKLSYPDEGLSWTSSDRYGRVLSLYSDRIQLHSDRHYHLALERSTRLHTPVVNLNMCELLYTHVTYELRVHVFACV